MFKSISDFYRRNRVKLLLFLSIFGPATITAMADNDASGVATYAIAGAKLGYPILFLLLWVTLLLAITQEMGVRVSLVTRKGLGDLIREHYGVGISIIVFTALFIANFFTLIVEIAAFKTAALVLNLPVMPIMIILFFIIVLFVIKGNYKMTQNIMLLSSLFYLAYIFSAFKAQPDWSLAFKNIAWPQGVDFTPQYIRDYLIIGLGVIGTTITPWGQFFISSFGLDKKITTAKLKYSQIEAYWGAFLTDFFSFFMIVATAATLYVNGIELVDGTQASLAIEPFAGRLASTLFAFGIMNAGFMGLVIVALCTTYAFSEFFGFSGSLDEPFNKSKTFYYLFVGQILVAFIISLLPVIDLFKIALTVQIVNAMVLPIIFYFLIKITNNVEIMGKYVNTPFQRRAVTIGTTIIIIASLFTTASLIFGF